MRISKHHDPGRGLLAALKVMAVVAAVTVLAMVAGKSTYSPVPGAVVSPAYVLPALNQGPAANLAPQTQGSRVVANPSP